MAFSQRAAVRKDGQIHNSGAIAILAEQNPILAAVFESVDCGIMFFGADGKLQFVNSRLSAIFHIDPTLLGNLENFDAVVNELAPNLAAPAIQAAQWRHGCERGEPSWDVVELLRPARKTIERSARPVRDE